VVPLVIATSGTAAALAEAHTALVKPEAAAKPGAKSGGRLARTAATARVAKLASRASGSGAYAASPAAIGDYDAAAGAAAGCEAAQDEYGGALAVPGIGPKRAEIIVAGAFVYAELLETFDLAGFRYSDLGLRDGILAQMLAEKDDRATAHLQFEQERWESVLATAKRYGVNLRQAEPVKNHAEQLYRDLATLHRLPAEYENWLAAAAMLSETGKFLNHQGHHRHTQYIISSSEIYGYTMLQRTIISAIARYLGKTRPQPGDRAMRNIPPQEHENVHKSVVLLRLAERSIRIGHPMCCV
jgi:exopolyphosphatase/guanosine-5'-triphosphate,3'-diphosphate pyrophosphatase